MRAQQLEELPVVGAQALAMLEQRVERQRAGHLAVHLQRHAGAERGAFLRQAGALAGTSMGGAPDSSNTAICSQPSRLATTSSTACSTCPRSSVACRRCVA